jgi:hypothetical protein
MTTPEGRAQAKKRTMRVTVFVKATEDSEKDVLPTAEASEAMERFTEELVKAGVMVAGGVLKPAPTPSASPSMFPAARSSTGGRRTFEVAQGWNKNRAWGPASVLATRYTRYPVRRT